MFNTEPERQQFLSFVFMTVRTWDIASVSFFGSCTYIGFCYLDHIHYHHTILNIITHVALYFDISLAKFYQKIVKTIDLIIHTLSNPITVVSEAYALSRKSDTSKDEKGIEVAKPIKCSTSHYKNPRAAFNWWKTCVNAVFHRISRRINMKVHNFHIYPSTNSPFLGLPFAEI